MDVLFGVEFFTLFIPLGVLAGVIAGMFGVGGGLIIVPALYWILPVLSASGTIPHDKIMHVAIGTSLAIIVLTSLSSAWSHFKKDAIDTKALVRLTPGLLLGAALSALVANSFSTTFLKYFFIVFELLVAVQLFLGVGVKSHRTLPSPVSTAVAGGIIGLISGLVGIGGGTLTVPFLIWCNYDIKKAIGTSAACGLPIAFAGMLGFIWLGLDAKQMPAGTMGYVYWPAFIGIGVMSVLFAPVGVKLAHSLPSYWLKKLFSIFILLVAIKMAW